MEQKAISIKLVQRLAEAIERSSPSEIESLLAGRSELVISNAGSSGIGRNNKPGFKRKPEPSKKNLAELVVRIRELESREGGWDLLKRSELTKRELEELARLMDLPVLREDDAQRLRQKIIEESIGARLNSQAIRG